MSKFGPQISSSPASAQEAQSPETSCSRNPTHTIPHTQFSAPTFQSQKRRFNNLEEKTLEIRSGMQLK